MAGVCGSRAAPSRTTSTGRSTAIAGYAVTPVLSALIAGARPCGRSASCASSVGGSWSRVPARALLADLVPREAYGRAYGFERAMDNLGAIIGPLLAIALVASVGVRSAIALSVIPGLLAVAAIACGSSDPGVALDRAAPDPAPDPTRAAGRASAHDGRDRRVRARQRRRHASDPSVPHLLTQTHTQGEAVQISSVLYAGYNVAATARASSPARGRSVRRPPHVRRRRRDVPARLHRVRRAGASGPCSQAPSRLAGCGIGISRHPSTPSSPHAPHSSRRSSSTTHFTLPLSRSLSLPQVWMIASLFACYQVRPFDIKLSLADGSP